MTRRPTFRTIHVAVAVSRRFRFQLLGNISSVYLVDRSYVAVRGGFVAVFEEWRFQLSNVAFLKLFKVQGLFERPEENRLMLEQYLADLEARYVSALAKQQGAKDDESPIRVAGKVIEAYRHYRKSNAGSHPGRESKDSPLPSWNDAFLAEQLLSGLLSTGEARSEFIRQLGLLKGVDATAYAELSAEWDGIKGDTAVADARSPALLATAQRAVQWKNTQRWIIRRLGIRYASRLRAAFVTALVLGFFLLLADAWLGPRLHSAAVSGLGFAAAAGLLGASFSAMVGSNQVLELNNIEEANAATSKQVIALRLGVGLAAAIILYFFFESGLVSGALFPDLGQIGFGRVFPIGSELDALRVKVQELDNSAAKLVASMSSAEQLVRSALGGAGLDPVLMKKGEALAPTPELLNALTASADGMKTVGAQIEQMRSSWMENRPLGSLTPNSDLSKLVVWCFAAGFTQTLVPQLLARVASQDQAAPAPGTSSAREKL